MGMLEDFCVAIEELNKTVTFSVRKTRKDPARVRFLEPASRSFPNATMHKRCLSLTGAGVVLPAC